MAAVGIDREWHGEGPWIREGVTPLPRLPVQPIRATRWPSVCPLTQIALRVMATS
jgi:hypothetical protein